MASFDSMMGGFEVAELGLTIMAGPSTVCGGLGLFIALDENTADVEVPANTIISGYSQRGSFAEEAKGDKTVAFLFDTLKRGVIFDRKYQSLGDVLASKRQLLGHSIDRNDNETLIPDTDMKRRYYIPAPVEIIESEGIAYTPQEIGVYANDLAFKGKGTTMDEYNERNDKLNVLELVWRLEEDEVDPTILKPTWPVVISKRDILFTNMEPMEVGLSYGWTYWKETINPDKI
jgi:hypothetical protein